MNSNENSTMKNINGPHCQSCGSTSAEDIGNLADTEGYTRCCNERVVITERSDWNMRQGYHQVEITCAEYGDCYHD